MDEIDRLMEITAHIITARELLRIETTLRTQREQARLRQSRKRTLAATTLPEHSDAPQRELRRA